MPKAFSFPRGAGASTTELQWENERNSSTGCIPPRRGGGGGGEPQVPLLRNHESIAMIERQISNASPFVYLPDRLTPVPRPTYPRGGDPELSYKQSSLYQQDRNKNSELSEKASYPAAEGDGGGGEPQVSLLRNRNAAYVFNVKRLHLAFSDP